MISNQILQSTIDGLKSITRKELSVVEKEGKVIATTEENMIGRQIDAVENFISSPAESQLILGYQYFKIYDNGVPEYVIQVKGEDESGYQIGKIAAFQIQSLLVAYKERYDKDNFIKNLLLDNLLLGEDGNLTQVVRDVLQLFSSRGGRLTVFSQRSPRAVRSILGSVRLAAPALVCGGTMAYHYADGNRVPLCSFAQQQELFACLPDTPGVGVAVQMQDGTTRVLRMSNALERHLRQEWTPYLLANAADIHPDQVLRVLLYQDSKSVPLISLAEKAIGDRVALLGERIAPDTLVLTPKRISGREMLDTVCTMAQVGAEQVLALAGGQPMLELVQAVEHSAVAADAPAELRLAAGQVTLTDAAGGAAVEVLYRMVRVAEKSV